MEIDLNQITEYFKNFLLGTGGAVFAQSILGIIKLPKEGYQSHNELFSRLIGPLLSSVAIGILSINKPEIAYSIFVISSLLVFFKMLLYRTE